MAGKTMSGRNGLSGQFRLLMAKANITGRTTERRGEKGRNRSSLTFHSLRHSFNSAMANAGVSQELRQRQSPQSSRCSKSVPLWCGWLL
jgi:integrase